MPRFLTDLWTRLHDAEWFLRLPPWLREPPGIYVAALVLAVLGAWLLATFVRLFFGREEAPRKARSPRDLLRREIRELRRQGDFLAVGQRYEALGKDSAALDAYRAGGCHSQLAALLLRRGRRAKAREAALRGEDWGLYARICEEDGDHAEAARALERDGQSTAAARAWQKAGQTLEAARCFVKAGMEYDAARLLMDGEGRDTAEALEKVLRSYLVTTRGAAMSVEMVAALRRAAQLWLAEGDAGRAGRLAVDAEQWSVAVPIVRDYLEPSPAAAEICLKAGAHLAAAQIYEKLGDVRREALNRAEHFARQDNAAEAGHWYETAEEWSQAAEHRAAAGELERAAELYARAEEFDLAAKLYADAGQADLRREMESLARAHDPVTALQASEATAALPREADVPPAPAMPIAEPERYQIRELIARGGMGLVYQAWDTTLHRDVAFKILPADSAEGGSDGLLKEARAAARLSHPNIVQVHDAGRTADGFFVVMELISGETFATLLKKKRLSVRGVANVGRQICAALAHAHQRRIIHRDLKPSNLMWTREGQVKLTDFGLARAFDESAGKVQTQAAGTPYYMAPEQIRGEPVDVRTDLYSLGCVLFEMLCGRAPFHGGSSIYHHLNSPPDDPRDSRREVPEPLAGIILRCLEKDPEKRPRSAEEVGRALMEVA